MADDRNTRNTDPQHDYYNRRQPQDYGRDYGSGQAYSSSSARDYQAAGQYDRDDRNRGDDRYGRQQYGNADYGRGGDDRGGNGDRSFRNQSYGQGGGYGQNDRGYGQGGGQARYARGDEYHGSYASDGRRFEDVGDRRDWDDDNSDRNRSYGRDRDRDYGRQAYGNQSYGSQSYGDRSRGDQPYGGRSYGNQSRGGEDRDYGRAPQGYDYQDRGFMQRAGDEVRSWFGDEDAERRREMDSRYDERYYNQRGGNDRDSDYHSWRSGQIAALDRDYDEYRQENRSRFENEFSSWRSGRQTQRDSLNKVEEHAEVVGSDGQHVGTVDKVRGDRILLTKNDADAGGQHHSIPSSWLQSVEDKKVTLNKSAADAKKQWRDEEQKSAMFGYGDNARGQQGGGNRSAGMSGQSNDATTGQSGATGEQNRSRSYTGNDSDSDKKS